MRALGITIRFIWKRCSYAMLCVVVQMDTDSKTKIAEEGRDLPFLKDENIYLEELQLRNVFHGRANGFCAMIWAVDREVRREFGVSR